MNEVTVSDVESRALRGKRIVDHSALIHLAGKYLSFSLAQEVYGIELSNIQEIVGVMHITSVPKSPEYMKGVINLREKIIPVIDLRLKFGMVEKDHDNKTCIIIVKTMLKEQSLTVGVVVDSVLEVIDFSTEQLQPSPDYEIVANLTFVDALGKVGEKFVILLDINKVLRDETDMFGDI